MVSEVSMASKRIAISIRQLTKTTGTARTTFKQIKRLADLGHDVHAFSEFIDTRKVRKLGGTPHHYSGWPLKDFQRRRFYAWRVERKTKNFDLVIGHGDIVQQNILYLHNCVHAAHEKIQRRPLPDDHTMGRIHGRILREQRFDVLVANSELMKSDVIERFRIPAEKVQVIYPGYNQEQFRIEDRAQHRESTRSELGVRDEITLVGLITSGNFSKRNADGFIEAISLLPRPLRRQCHFLIIGKQDRQRPMEALAKMERIRHRITFLDPTPDVHRYYHALDLFVLPARWEEFGQVVAEAMACSLPVLISKDVGCAEILTGEQRDWILPSIGPAAMAERMKALIEDRELRERLGRLNLEAVQPFGHDQQFEKQLKLLQNWL